MVKWADYGISAVRYNSKGTHIEKVKVHIDKGDTMEPTGEWFRTDVVSSLEKGHTFVTILLSNEGKWDKGEEVGIVHHPNGEKYIRTDKDYTAADNLKNLPRF